MEKAKKSVEQMAKEDYERIWNCINCSLFMGCNIPTQKVCREAFIEGYIKGYKQGRKG